MTTYILAGGCFWCLDAVYRRLKGVTFVESGYTGGFIDTPSYPLVSTGQTGHAEAVKVSFDETVIPSDTILDIFFLVHDPTTLNRQGADVGTQYRSAMFYTDAAQHHEFDSAIARAQERWDDPIVSEVVPLVKYFPAEAEHQDFFTKNPESGYCSIVIVPKVIKARSAYTKWFREDV